MLSAGKRIVDTHDKLVRIDNEYLFNQIKTPRQDVESRIRNLRLVYSLDKKRYSQLKRELPYVVCAAFNPEFRRTENFAYCDSFIIDLDHLGDHNRNAQEVKEILSTDSRVAMCFISPSGDGLKLLFKLEEKCYDAGEFTVFYKAFARQFAIENGLTEIIDTKTCDVCRACFVSHDSEVYYNPEAEAIALKQVMAQFHETAFTSTTIKDDKKSASTAQEATEESTPAKESNDPDDEIMSRIKQQLNLVRAKERAKHDFFVPSEIETVMVGVRNIISETGVTISEERNIQYGKQLVLTCQLRKAELNIFFGRRGFSVVEQPRRGTSQQLNSMMGELVRGYLNSLSN